jgi:hypothetical protein
MNFRYKHLGSSRQMSLSRLLNKPSNILLYIVLFAAMVFLFNHLLIPPEMPEPRPLEQPYSCEKDFGYSNLSLEEIQSTRTNLSEINRYVYTFKTNGACTSRSQVLLLILVKSSAGNFRKRRYIRTTWGNDARKRGHIVVFLLGYSEIDNVFVKYENEMYNDIIQQNFQESYYNNTLKIKMAFHWIRHFCQSAQYVLIVDDDMYVNIRNTIYYISGLNKRKNTHLYSGYFIQEPFPDRKIDSKHYISEQQYPYYCYPPYIAGASIFLNQHTVERFFHVMPYIPYIPFDDVFIGFLAQKLRISPSNNKLIRLGKNSFQASRAGDIRCSISQHGYEIYFMFRIAYNTTHSQIDSVI